MRKSFLGLRQFVLALIILLGILIFPGVGIQILLQVNKEMAYLLLTVGPHSVSSWLFLLVDIFWYPIALTVWVVRDAMKFKKLGLKTSPLLWGIGTILPTVLVVFPIYFILRNVVWRRRPATNNINSMEAKKGFGLSKRVREIFLSVVAIAFVVYVIVVVTDFPQKLNKGRTEEQVAKIHATKLTLDDVMGANLPPEPNQELNDSTIEGIDANQNGIRDDVELAIFKEYPNSAKTRAVLLQYAFNLQMEVVQKLVNSETVTAVAEESSRASLCITEVVPHGLNLSEAELEKAFKMLDDFIEFVDTRQLNTVARKEASKNFYEGKLRSFSTPRDRPVCDIDLSSLPN
jgi:hypothetical protein